MLGDAVALELRKLSPPLMIGFGLLTLSIFAALGFEEYNTRTNVARTLQWSTCQGTITSHTVTKPDYVTSINYAYEAGGKPFSGNRVFYDQSNDTLRHPFD